MGKLKPSQVLARTRRGLKRADVRCHPDAHRLPRRQDPNLHARSQGFLVILRRRSLSYHTQLPVISTVICKKRTVTRSEIAHRIVPKERYDLLNQVPELLPSTMNVPKYPSRHFFTLSKTTKQSSSLPRKPRQPPPEQFWRILTS